MKGDYFMKAQLQTILWIFKHSKSTLHLLIATTFISGILSLIGVYSALISKSLIDAATSGEMNTVIFWLSMIALIYIIRLFLNSVNSILSTYSSTRLLHQIQKEIYESLIYSEWLAQSQYHSVNLLTRVTNDVSTVSSVIISTLNSTISIAVTFISAFVALYYIDSSIAIFTVIATPIFLLFSRVFGRKMKKYYQEIQEQDAIYRSFIQESIQNLMIIKTFCQEQQNLNQLNDHHDKKLTLNLRSTKLGIVSSTLFGTLSYIIYFIIYGLSVLKMTTGEMTFGSMTALLQLYYKVSGPISSFASLAKQFITGIGAAERLMEIENLPHENRTNELSSLPTEPVIEFENVTFGYDVNQPILKNLSLRIIPGETVGIVGPSGEGKTTFIRLILSLLKANQGILKINGESITPKHRKLISYVPQGNTLFSGTIRDNLKYGNPRATDKELIKACQQACAWDFIQKLPQQLNTKIGEKGMGLSEGQAQRIALARAFLRQTPILILDEATSSLDGQTEINVLESVKKLPHQPICLIITHRPSALDICDRILKLEKSKINIITK